MTANGDHAGGYVVVAEFQVATLSIEAFIALMRKHAALSREEPGCLAFEVSQDVTDPASFLFYERYSDERAYQDHRQSGHYARFREVAPQMLILHGGDIFHRRNVQRSII